MVDIKDSKVEVIKGDIVDQDTEAVVNAANKRLAPGGGVAGAIHRAAGSEMWQECKTIGGCKTGEAKITKGYNLKSKYVIHTVGPVYSGISKDAQMLKSCYQQSLEMAKKHCIKSISFPAISTGVFGYPITEAAEIAIDTAINWLKQNQGPIKLVRFVLYDAKSYQEHKKVMKKYE